VVHGKRVMVMLPASKAAKTHERTIPEIPPGVVDDASRDDTVGLALRLGIPVVVQPRNRGYGGNRKKRPGRLGDFRLFAPGGLRLGGLSREGVHSPVRASP
jgi:hypothetical protein